MIWIYFIAVVAVIIFSGFKLSELAEKLAELLNISSSAIGLLLVSIVTSLPELSTSLSAAVKVGQPNLAVGNTMGSDMLNLMIIAFCDLLFRKRGVLRNSDRSRIAQPLYYLLITSAMLISLYLPNSISLWGAHFNAGSLAVVGLYLFIFFRTHHTGQKIPDDLAPPPDLSVLKKTILKFTLASVCIVLAGLWLAKLGDQIAEQTGLEQSFVGTLFLAFATSLPELTVCISALRIGAVDLMLGNIFGSNMFNVFITAVTDLTYRKEAFHIPDNISHGMLSIGAASIAITLISILAMRQKKLARWVAWESIVVISAYLLALYTLYS